MNCLLVQIANVTSDKDNLTDHRDFRIASQMESDLAALGGLFAQVVAQVQKLTTPPDTKVKRVRVSEFFGGAMENEEQVRQAVAKLQDHLLKLLDEGVKIVVE
jgi:hypothetical protein